MEPFISISVVNNKVSNVVQYSEITEETPSVYYNEDIQHYVNLSNLNFTILVVKNNSGNERGIFTGPGSEATSSNQIVVKGNSEATVFIKLNGIIFNVDALVLA